MRAPMQPTTKIRTDGLTFYYGKTPILQDISVELEERRITAITGPSGSGKSSFLSVLNRMWTEIPGVHLQGEAHIRLGGQLHDLCDKRLPAQHLRRKVGMVFQTPNPLPMSIYRNVAFPLKLSGCRDRQQVAMRVESALRRTLLWEEVKDLRKKDARQRSGGQQQRLCIARSLVLEPEVLLLDEPTSALDGAASAGIEDLLLALNQDCTLVLVSHDLDQVNRLADKVYRVDNGRMVQL